MSYLRRLVDEVCEIHDESAKATVKEGDLFLPPEEYKRADKIFEKHRKSLEEAEATRKDKSSPSSPKLSREDEEAFDAWLVQQSDLRGTAEEETRPKKLVLRSRTQVKDRR